MRNLRMLALLLFGCAPSSPPETKAPHDLTACPPPAATSQPSLASATVKPAPEAPLAADSEATSELPPTESLRTTPSPLAPNVEGLSHHALPQTHLGFYAVLTPPGYDAPENATRRYPVVVIVHGKGSNEVVHSSLADDLGRQDVIYVVPRAPHPSPEQFAVGREGYSAFPSYPVQWGEYGSPTFPNAEIDKLQIHKYYTRWIADALLDARLRYRMSPSRAVVVGHSQGAMFAHLFAADYPALVKAYAAYAGPTRLTVKSFDGKRQLASLRSGNVSVLLAHREADTVVDVANTKQLDAMMTEHGVKHTTHILPGGTHATDPEVRRLLRDFMRERCCGKERSTADVPVGPSGTPSVPPMNDVLTFGADSCNTRISSLSPCDNPAEGEPARCEVYEAEPCGSHSLGYRSSTFACVDSIWTRISRAPAECGVNHEDPTVAGCSVQLFRTRPSEASKTDACDLVMRCGRVQTVVTCDGKNDGSSQSTCQCTRNGTAVELSSNVYPGEAPTSCLAAAELCTRPR